jgi:ABC-type transport system involved in multi-copper enzyme maturation permease subunit
MVPIIALEKQADPKIFSNIYLQSMFYSITLMLSLFISICTANANEMAEMTFIISRPVSRKVFLTAKSLCSICIALCFLI